MPETKHDTYGEVEIRKLVKFKNIDRTRIDADRFEIRPWSDRANQKGMEKIVCMSSGKLFGQISTKNGVSQLTTTFHAEELITEFMACCNLDCPISTKIKATTVHQLPGNDTLIRKCLEAGITIDYDGESQRLPTFTLEHDGCTVKVQVFGNADGPRKISVFADDIEGLDVFESKFLALF